LTRRSPTGALLACLLVLGFVLPATAIASSLRVVVGGLPLGEKASARITGPRGFKKTVLGSLAFRSLAPGKYTATVGSVVFRHTTTSGAVAGLRAIGTVGVGALAVGEHNIARSSSIFLKGTPGVFSVHYTSGVPAGGPVFKQLSGDSGVVCGLRRNSGIVTCWGDSFWLAARPPPAGAFTQIVGSDGGSCGLRPDGTAACWGVEEIYEPDPPADKFTQIAIGDDEYACGLHRDGSSRCWWGVDYFRSRGPLVPPGHFIQLTAAGGGANVAVVCGLRADHTATCAYEASNPIAGPGINPGATGVFSPAGSFSQLTQGLWGLQTDGTAASLPETPEGVPALSGNYAQLSSGGLCGVHPGGTVECLPLDGTPMPPLPGVFTQAVASQDWVCGLRPDGAAACWFRPGDSSGDPYNYDPAVLRVPQR